MQIWPAIDIARGKCVRLQQGDFSRETVFGDPLSLAQHWQRHGAECLHLVDLDGAREGQPQQLELAARIAQQTGLPCQLGGGFRTPAAVDRALGLGVSRVILGTASLVDGDDWVSRAIAQFPQRIAIGIDSREGHVAIRGWTETLPVSAVELARRFEGAPIAALIVTDVRADGMLQGPNWRLLQEIRDAVSAPLLASGGITTEQDIETLGQLGFAGAIVGRALYDGTLSLASAMAAAAQPTANP